MVILPSTAASSISCSSILVDVIPGSTLGAVFLLYPVEELVVLASNDTSITAAKDVDPQIGRAHV